MARLRPVRRTALGAAAVLAVLTCTAGCGGGSDDLADSSAQEIVDASQQDMKTLTSVHFDGDITNEGEDISLDLDVNTDGDCEGSFGLKAGKADIVALDGQTWFRPDEAFWRASSPDTAEQIIAAVGSKWVALGEDDDTFDSFCDLSQLLDELFKTDDGDGDYAKDGTEDVDGQEAFKVTRDDSEGGTVSGYVAVEGEHYLLRLERAGDDSGTVTFSAFDEKLDISAPDSADVVDINDLG